jgi:hypothetical protein
MDALVIMINDRGAVEKKSVFGEIIDGETLLLGIMRHQDLMAIDFTNR